MPVKKITHCFLLLIAIFFSATGILFAQTKITGKVYDELTNEPIPFANVLFKGTTTGAATDINGKYVLETKFPYDSVSVTFIGYKKNTRHVTFGKTQTINFALVLDKVSLSAVEITGERNPGLMLVKKVILHKPENDKNDLDAYQYESYNKLEFDLNNITEKFMNKKLFKPFKFIFNNIDSDDTGKNHFLPVFISETLSDIYFRKSPKEKKEIIKANKISGTENPTVTQFLGDMYQNINVYDNYVYILKKGFVSPLASFGSVNYKYTLVDSAFFGDKWCYKVTFHPRFKQTLTFTGDMWINDTTFAIKKITMRIADDANINFIQDLIFVDEYERINNQQWMLVKDKLVLNFAPSDNDSKEKLAFIARKTTTYKNFVLSQPKTDEFYSGESIVIEDSARNRSDEFWNNSRHDSLSKSEKQIYHMIDTIKSLPAYKTYVEIITLIITGYKDFDKIQVGSYFSLYSFNKIEGSRFRIGVRTSPKFSTDLYLKGYVAYGTKDQRFKYSGGLQYFLSKKPRTYIELGYKDDVEQLGQSDNFFQGSNIFTSIFRREPVDKLNSIIEEKISFDREWAHGFTLGAGVMHRDYTPLGLLDFTYFTDDTHNTQSNQLSTTTVTFTSRFAYKEKYVEGKRDRISLGSRYPILKAQFTLGMKDVLGGNFNYKKLVFKLDDFLQLGNFGFSYYNIEAGKIWGTLPFPLLEVHKGNETYAYDYLAFNLMNYYEFVSDQYLAVEFTHHFGGYFLNRIPLLRKLKWRELISGRILMGSLTDANRNILKNPDAFYTLVKPYSEVNVGIENILKIFRMDLVWRLNYLDHPHVDRIGLRGSLSINF